jgi:type IV secretory pathway VirJ component
MEPMRRLLLLILLLLPAWRVMAAEPQEIAMGGRFGTVTVYQPTGPAKSVVLFVSGDGGWHLGVTGMARHLTEQGAIVVGIDVRHYLAALGAAQQSCVSMAADFELLSHDVQKKLALPSYLPPVLAGYSSGATVVYAVLAQSPPGTFTGAISFGFCADQDFKAKPLCPGNGLRYSVNRRGDFVVEPQAKLEDRWVAMQGQVDQVCAAEAVDAFAARIPNAEVQRLPKVGHGFGVEKNWLPQLRDAFGRLQESSAPAMEATRATSAAQPIAAMPAASTTQPASAKPALLSALPLVEVPASASAPAADSFAILISGDGGWAGLDRSIAKSFAARGIPVVGLDSLRYFWAEKTPDATARDLAAIIQQYQQRWHRNAVHLLGYSFGADVLPFAVNRLPPPLATMVRSVTLVAPSESAIFEIHVSNWLPGVTTPGLPLPPELARMATPPLCIHGAGETDTPCGGLPRELLVTIGNGHHLGGDADGIVARVLQRKSTSACAGKDPCG